jgi:hypothetical protein
MNRPLRANDVEVEVIRRARCKLPDCGWKGGEHKLYPEANADRQAHMTWHRNGEPAQPAAAWPIPHPSVTFVNAINGHGEAKCYRTDEEAFDATSTYQPFNNTRISAGRCSNDHTLASVPEPTHLFPGSSKERQQVGHPGHCDDCALVGHVKAHPDLGCADVGCTAAHTDTWVHGSRLGREHLSVRTHLLEDHGVDRQDIADASDGALHGLHDGKHATTWAYSKDLPHTLMEAIRG